MNIERDKVEDLASGFSEMIYDGDRIRLSNEAGKRGLVLLAVNDENDT